MLLQFHAPRGGQNMVKQILFMNIAWMRFYRGIAGDTPEGGFRYMLERRGTPNEIFNFLPYRGRCYGYAAVPDGSINIKRLGASQGDEFIDNVLVVWTATQPSVGNFIVGWYDGARVFAELQERPVTPETRAINEDLYYNVVAPAKACRLLRLDERVFHVPHGKRGFPGMAPSFFPEGVSPRKWVESVRRFVAEGKVETNVPKKRKGRGGGRSLDPERGDTKQEVAAGGCGVPPGLHAWQSRRRRQFDRA
jgi:hypothetical protein